MLGFSRKCFKLAHLLPVPGSCSAAGCSSCCSAAGCSSCRSVNSSPCGSLRMVRTRIPSAERSADTSPAWIPSVRQYLHRQNTNILFRGLQGDVVYLGWPTAPSYFESKCDGRWGYAGSQPMSTAVHITWHGAQINLGDLTPYLTYEIIAVHKRLTTSFMKKNLTELSLPSFTDGLTRGGFSRYRYKIKLPEY